MTCQSLFLNRYPFKMYIQEITTPYFTSTKREKGVKDFTFIPKSKDTIIKLHSHLPKI